MTRSSAEGRVHGVGRADSRPSGALPVMDVRAVGVAALLGEDSFDARQASGMGPHLKFHETRDKRHFDPTLMSK